MQKSFVRFAHRFALSAMAGVGALVLAFPLAAGAAPSNDDIDRAKAEEAAARMSVAQIEVQLATQKATADQTMVRAQQAAEAYDEARIDLQQANEEAQEAQRDAEKAQRAFERGRKRLASVAQTTYRAGSGSLDSIAPYVDSDGLEQVEQKQKALDSFGSAADSEMQKVAALENVAKVTKKAADAALKKKQRAAAAVKAKADAAQQAADSALATQKRTEQQRGVLVEALAKKHHTTVRLETERQEAIEAARQRRAEAQARERLEAQQRAAAQAQREAARRAAAQAAQQSAPARTSTSSGASSSGSTTRRSSGSSGSTPTRSSGGSKTTTPVVTRPSRSSSSIVEGAIAYAERQLGKPYRWGAAGPWGFDCSGLVVAAYGSQGVGLTHQSEALYYDTTPTYSWKRGDLLFWSSNGSASGIYHVAIYLGGGQMIEAPTFGLSVRITSVRYSGILSTAGRVV